MQHLFVVRHGNYDNSGGLTHSGRGQISRVGEFLKPQVEGKQTKLLTSTAIRASQSADIIGEILGVKPVAAGVLWSESDWQYQPDQALALVQEHDAEVIIVVTHYEYAEAFPDFVAQKLLGLKPGKRMMSKGGLCHIDIVSRLVRYPI